MTADQSRLQISIMIGFSNFVSRQNRAALLPRHFPFVFSFSFAPTEDNKQQGCPRQRPKWRSHQQVHLNPSKHGRTLRYESAAIARIFGVKFSKPRYPEIYLPAELDKTRWAGDRSEQASCRASSARETDKHAVQANPHTCR